MRTAWTVSCQETIALPFGGNATTPFTSTASSSGSTLRLPTLIVPCVVALGNGNRNQTTLTLNQTNSTLLLLLLLLLLLHQPLLPPLLLLLRTAWSYPSLYSAFNNGRRALLRKRMVTEQLIVHASAQLHSVYYNKHRREEKRRTKKRK
jgi:hypothetical protein